MSLECNTSSLTLVTLIALAMVASELYAHLSMNKTELFPFIPDNII
jgi:hypothetical protein